MSGSFVEALESRRLLSAVLPTNQLASRSPSSSSSVAVTTTILQGTTINAEATQSFQAVIGTIKGLSSLPSAYSLHGVINWGDGSAASAAQFVHQSDGSIAVLGDHTYASVGTDTIKVTVAAVPPPGTALPVRLIGTFQSKANVISSPGAVTLEETAGVAFTATVGFFSSNLSSLTMTATITWGDGTQSSGKILALPTAGLVPRFAVSGSHTYAKTGSYITHVTVYSSIPSAFTPPVILVAQIDSVIDVLPPLPTA